MNSANLKNMLVLQTLAESSGWKEAVFNYLPGSNRVSDDTVFLMDDEVDPGFDATSSVFSEPTFDSEEKTEQLQALLRQFVEKREILSETCDSLTFHLCDSLSVLYDKKWSEYKREILPTHQERALKSNASKEIKSVYKRGKLSHAFIPRKTQFPSVIKRVLEQFVLCELWVNCVTSTLAELQENTSHVKATGVKRARLIAVQEESLWTNIAKLADISDAIVSLLH